MTALFERITGLTLADPALLLLALFVPVALVIRGVRRPTIRFGPASMATGLPRTWRQLLRATPATLRVIGLLLIVVAIARPVRRDPLPPTTEGIDILLCVDASSSMTATDLDPERTRLEVAKDEAARFVAGRPDDRVGLVLFARYPDLRCPPTLDHRALGKLLADIRPVDAEGPEDATGIGTAVARAAQVLESGNARSRVLILLTDGEENVATPEATDEIAPLHAAQLCQELGVRAYAVAVGLGRQVPTGEWAPLDTTPIRRLAERTGGRFFEVRDVTALATTYAEIDALETVALAEPAYRLEDHYLGFLLTALALLGVSGLLSSTVWAVLP